MTNSDYRPRAAALLTFAGTLLVPALLAAQTPARTDSSGAPRKLLPLEPAGKLEFTLREGTWISLDVMPDGKSLVFELLGDFYTLPIAGGKATRITEGLGYDSQPRVSPDGKWIAYISDRDGADNLWIAKIDGTEPRKLSSETQIPVLSPSWTPDSKYILVSRRAATAEFRMYHIDGGSGVALAGSTPTGQRPDGMGATLSPNGKYLYYARRPTPQSGGGGGGGAFNAYQLVQRDMRTGDTDVITQAEWGAFRPAVSPDGRVIVYATRHETQTGLRMRDLQTGADRWLVWPIQRDEQESGATRDLLPGYAFRPDGRELIVAYGGKINAVDVFSGDAREIPFEADVKLDIGPDLEFPYKVEQGPVKARLVQTPSFSPDGKRVVFSVLTKLYTMDVPGGTPKRLTNGNDWEFQPAWSPDGQWIAYVTWTTEGGHIWKMRADGRGQPQRLTSAAAFYTDLAFSPDNAKIVGLRGNAFMRNQTFSEFGGLRIPLDVVWVPATGGEVQLIVPARGVGAPHFTNERDRVYVYSRDGLISMRLDGTDRVNHLKVNGRPNPRSNTPPTANAVMMRSDGNYALAVSENQLYVMAVPPAGGEAPTVGVTGGAVPVKKLTDIGADYFGWAENGKTVFWAIGSTIFRRPFDSIVWRDSAAAAAARDTTARRDTTAARDTTRRAQAVARKVKDEDPGVERFDVNLTFPRAKPSGTVVLRNATVITMKGNDAPVRADIVVTDNRIASISPAGSVNVPPGAREFDFAGKYVVPGFVDTHAHWEFRTHDVLEPHNWSLLANLAYGVTAGLDVQTSTNDYFAYQDLIEIGAAIGQRAFMVGPGVFSRNDFRNYEEVEAYLQRYKEYYRTPNIKSYMVGNRQQRQWVVTASKKLGLMPTTEGGSDMKLDITHAIDGFHGNEHTLPVVPLYDDVVQLYARTKTAYTPTLLVAYGGPIADEYWFSRENVHDDVKLNRFYPHNWLDQLTRRRSRWVRDDEFIFPQVAAGAARIQRAGGLVGVGGHGELQGLGYHWEMWGLAMGGMTPREILKAATIDGARIIGFDQDLGSIEVGKLADLAVLDRNPLENIRNTNSVRYVMKNGELYEAETLTQVWPVRKGLPRLWWWNDGPRKSVTSSQQDK
ncbi:MAG: amidohydrolase family protein [Longimicrobiales bacterium]